MYMIDLGLEKCTNKNIAINEVTLNNFTQISGVKYKEQARRELVESY